MTEYGQSLANKVVHLTGVLTYSKLGFAEVLCKALRDVGMVFLPSISTYDIFDAANSEKSTGWSTGDNLVNFFFDFPSSETFVIAGVQYRPIFGINASINTGATGSVGSQYTNSLTVRLGYRRADRIARSDFRTFHYFRISSGNNGFGTTGDSVTSSSEDGAFFPTDAQVGTVWRAYSSLVQTNSALRTFGSVYVYLGKAGLFLFVGGGTSRFDFNNHLSFGCAFAGGRLPGAGRSRIPAQDVNLNRINPTFPMPFKSTHDDFNNGGVLRGPVTGMQYNLKSLAEGNVFSYLFNLENVEQPLFPSLVAHTLRSPRIVNGQGRFILSQPVHVPQHNLANTTDLYNVVDTQIDSSSIRPQWEDCFTCPALRFGDKTVTTPAEYEDPISGTNWFLVNHNATNTAIALHYEGRIIANVVTTPPAYTTVDTDSYDMTTGGFAAAFPTTVTITNTSTAPTWAADAGQNSASVTRVLSTSSGNRDITFAIAVDPTDLADTLYELSVDLRIQRTAGPGTHTLSLITPTVTGGTQTAASVSVTVTGSNAAQPEFNYQTFTVPLVRAQDGTFTITIRFSHTGNQVSEVGSFRNLIITKKRRL